MIQFDTMRNSMSGVGDTVMDCREDGLDLRGTRTEPRSIPATMCKEECRLRTFSHWPNDWAEVLARFGFCRLNGDSESSVRCAFCSLEIPDFTCPEDAQLKHWQSARHYCRFLKGEDVSNIPLNGSYPGWIYQTVPTSQNGRSVTVQNLPTRPGTDVEETRLLRAPASLSEQPSQSHVHFSFIPPSDIVHHHQRCSTSRSSPRYEPETTVCISHTPAEPVHQAPKPASSAWWRSGPGEEAPSTNEFHWTDMVRTARYPRMAPFQARLDTLRGWPLLKPSPTELAKAGFFHVKCSSSHSQHHLQVSGKIGAGVCEDSVKCFWCGERIHRWRKTDDALLEHARLSPHCRYVIQVLGQQCHDDIVRYVTSTSGHHARCQTTSHPATLQPTTTSLPPPLMTSSQLDDVMQSPSAQKVLQMGFPRQLIRDLLSHSSQRLTPETLCNLALQTVEQTSRASSGSERTRIPCGDNTQRSIQAERTTSPPHEHTRLVDSQTFPPPGGRTPGFTDDLTTKLDESQTFIQPTRTITSCDNEQRVLDKPQTFLQSGSTSCIKESKNLAESQALSVARTQTRSEDRLMCKVCSEAEVKVIFRPCNHLVCCRRCMALFTSCPVCHQIIEDILTVYLT